MKRLLYVTQYYASKDQPGASRHYQHIRALMSHGYRVTLITSYVSNRLRTIPPEYRGKRIAVEQDGDLRVYKAYAYPGYGSDLLSRLRNYLSFVFYAMVAGLRAPACDMVFASSPSLFVGLIGYVISRSRRVPYVLEVRDLWPDAAVVMGALRHPLAIRMSAWLAAFLYQRARRVVAVTEGIRQGILGTGVSPEKVVFIPNGVDDELYRDPSRSEAEEVRQQYGWDNRFVAIYAGTLARSDGLPAIVRAAASLSEFKDLLLVFLGDGEVKPHLNRLVQENQLCNVMFISSQPKCRVPDFIRAADVCLMPVKNDAFFQMHLPNKLFDYMAGARPVIAAVPPGEAQRLVQRADAGLVVPPEDEIGIATALLDLRDDPQACRRYGENGRKYAMQHYLRSRLAGQLISTLDTVVEKQSKRKSL